GEAEHLADEVDEEEPGLDVGLVLLAVDRHLDVHDRHLPPPARSIALRSARGVSPRPMSFLYSTEPRRSASGWAASAASCAACLIAASSGRFPRSAASAWVALIGVNPA